MPAPSPALLRLPAFRRLASATALSSIGMMGETVVLGWLALELTNSPFLVGVATTWLINRSLAFRGRLQGVPIWREFLNYLGAMILGGSVNYAIYAVLVALVPFVAEHLIVGVAAGVAGGMVVNFLLADKLVFKSRVPPQSV